MINRKLTNTTADLVPVREIRDGLLLTADGAAVKILEVEPVNFRLKSGRDRETICDGFQRFLRTAPDRFQIKILSTRPDLRETMKRRLEETQEERDPACRKMQQDLNDLILSHAAENAVQRRCFLCLRADGSAGFETAAAQLKAMAAESVYRLSACGNRVTDPTDPCGILRLSVSRTHGGAPDTFLPVRADLTRPDAVCVDGTWTCYAVIPSNGYHPDVTAGWLCNLIEAGEGIDLDLFMEKKNREQALRSIRTVINRSKASLSDLQDTLESFDSLTDAVSSGYYLKQGLAAGEDLWELSLLLTFSGPSYEAAREKLEWMKKSLLSLDIRLSELRFEEEQGFLSSLPLCAPDRSVTGRSARNLLTADAASLYPFCSAVFHDPDGIYLGTDSAGGSLVMCDLFDTSKYKNANVFLAGVTGAGKTFALSLMAMRMRLKQIPALIIAPEKEHEFRRLCTGMGGQFIQLGGGSPDRINILDIRRPSSRTAQVLDGITREYSLLSAKIKSLRTFFRLLVPDLSMEEKQLCDEALLLAYAGKGITMDNDTLTPGREMPVLEDVYDAMARLKPDSRVLYALKMLVHGSERSFNGHTNVQTDNSFTVLGLENIDPDLLPLGMFMAMDYAWSRIREDRTEKKCLFIDEWWRFAFDPAAAAYSLEIAKTIRAYGGSLILATQQLSDIFGAEDGKYGLGVLGCCATRIILQLEPREAAAVRELLDLTDEAVSRIPTLRQGEALLHTGGNSLQMRFDSSPSEFDLITTDRAALARMMKEAQKEVLS